jgi:hypothetical protein
MRKAGNARKKKRGKFFENWSRRVFDSLLQSRPVASESRIILVFHIKLLTTKPVMSLPVKKFPFFSNMEVYE